MSVQIAWVEGADRLHGLESDYRRLETECLHTTVFNEWTWIKAASEHLVAQGRRVRTLTARSGGKLVGCLPMTWGRETIVKIPVRTLRSLGYPYTDRFTPMVSGNSPDIRQALVQALLDPSLSESDVTLLSEVPLAQAALDPANGRIHTRVCARAPVLDVSDPERVKADLSKGLRTRLIRARKKLAAVGRTRFERLTPSREDVPRLLDIIAGIESRSWKGLEGVGIFSTPESSALFRKVALALSDEGRLEILFLWLNDQVVSYRFGFRRESTFLDYNFAHPIDLDALSVGRVLLAEAIETASSAGITVFDASRGSLTKPNILHDWTGNAIEHAEVWLFARSIRGNLLRLAVVKGKPLAKQIMKRVEAA